MPRRMTFSQRQRRLRWLLVYANKKAGFVSPETITNANRFMTITAPIIYSHCLAGEGGEMVRGKYLGDVAPNTGIGGIKLFF